MASTGSRCAPRSEKEASDDYSTTINRHTLFYAYPLANINELVNKVAQAT